MGQVMNAVGFGLIGYLCGSLVFGIWIARLIKGIDVRDGGSGHTGATNVFRQVGFLPAVAVLVLDVAKGYFPTWLAVKYGSTEFAIVAAATMAVVGHCWPLFAKFRGGMGMATTGGAILVLYPLGFLIGLGFEIALVLIIRHSARASFVTGILLAPLFFLFGQRGVVIWSAIGVGVVLAIRFLSDWNRQYRELWLDRDIENEGAA